MPENKPPQNLANHTMLDPPFHFVFAPLLGVLLVYSIWSLVTAFSLGTALAVATVIAIGLAGFKGRIYSLKVQDRLIRLEERLRLQQVLPESMRSRIGDLTEDQLVGLRFAPDAELAGLVEKTLANGWKRKDIKQAIQNWRPDHFRV